VLPPDDADPALDEDPPLEGAAPPPLDPPPVGAGVVATEPDPTDELLPTELLAVDGLLTVTFGLAFGFLGGACSAGTAPAFVSGVMAACWALPALDWASDPVTVGADVFLTADPMANAATSPTTSAAASSSQRFRTLSPAGAAAIAATSVPDMNELSIRSVPPVSFPTQS
jgi:hypothetical protein